MKYDFYRLNGAQLYQLLSSMFEHAPDASSCINDDDFICLHNVVAEYYLDALYIIHGMDEFDDYCNNLSLSPSEVAECTQARFDCHDLYFVQCPSTGIFVSDNDPYELYDFLGNNLETMIYELLIRAKDAELNKCHLLDNFAFSLSLLWDYLQSNDKLREYLLPIMACTDDDDDDGATAD